MEKIKPGRSDMKKAIEGKTGGNETLKSYKKHHSKDT